MYNRLLIKIILFLILFSINTIAEINDTIIIDTNNIKYLDDIIITEKKFISKDNKNQILQIQELKTLPGSSKDIIKSIEFLPFINRSITYEWKNTGISFRGTNSDNSKYFLDDVPLLRLFHMNGLYSAINADILKQITIYPGGFDSYYGNSIGGLVNLESKKNVTKNNNYVDFSLIDFSFFTERSFLDNKLSFIASSRRSWLGDVFAWLSYDTEGIYQYLFDTYAKLSYNLNQKQHYYMSLLYAHNLIKNENYTALRINPYDTTYYKYVNPKDFKDSSSYYKAVYKFNSTNKIEYKSVDNKMYHDFFTIIGSSDNIISDNLNNKLRIAFIPTSFRIIDFDTALFKSIINGIYLRNELSHNVSNKFDQSIGCELWINKYFSYNSKPYLIFDIVNDNDSLKKYPIVNNKNNFYFGCFSGFFRTNYYNEKLLIKNGMRIDHFPELDYNGSIIPQFYSDQKFKLLINYPIEVSLRSSIEYNFDPKQVLLFSIGNYNKNYDPLYAKNNEPARACHINGKYKFSLTEDINVELQTYYQYMWNLQDYEIKKEKSKIKINGINLYGKAKSYGFEVFSQFRYNHNDFWLSYAYSRSKFLDNIHKKYILYEKDQPHNLKIIYINNTLNKLAFSTSINLASGFPKYPIVGELIHEHAGYTDFIYFREYLGRFDPYCSINVRVSYKYKSNKDIYFDIKSAQAIFFESDEFADIDLIYDDKIQQWYTKERYYKQLPIFTLGFKYFF